MSLENTASLRPHFTKLYIHLDMHKVLKIYYKYVTGELRVRQMEQEKESGYLKV
jgi:hypothetical protein